MTEAKELKAVDTPKMVLAEKVEHRRASVRQAVDDLLPIVGLVFEHRGHLDKESRTATRVNDGRMGPANP